MEHFFRFALDVTMGGCLWEDGRVTSYVVAGTGIGRY